MEIWSIFFQLCWRGLMVMAVLFLPISGQAGSLQGVGGQFAQRRAHSWSEAMEDIARENGLSPKLVQSIIEAESKGDARAVSPKGALGLMQLMPETAKEYRVTDPFDLLANIRGGVQYLRDLLREFSGDLALALAAYNAGPGAVHKYRGIPPYPETQSFVKKVKDRYHRGEEPIRSSVPGRANEIAPWERIPREIHLSGSPRDLAVFLQKMR